MVHLQDKICRRGDEEGRVPHPAAQASVRYTPRHSPGSFVRRDAFILAAGFGTRLRPLTNERPKPLVPLCGVPMISYAFHQCAHYGLHRVVVNAHWMADQVLRWSGSHEGCDVEVVAEHPEILGTGGGLRNVMERLGDRVAVLNADVIHDVDLRALVEATPEGGACLALRQHEVDAQRYGVVATDSRGQIVDLAGVAHVPGEEAVDRSTHFSGIHALDRRVLERVPEGFACIVRTAYSELVSEGLLYGLKRPLHWLDAGDPAAYLEANLDVLRGDVPTTLDPMKRAAASRNATGDQGTHPARLRDATIDGDVWIGEDVDLARGARLDQVVLGHGAKVPAGASLRRVIVWDGAEVPDRPLHNAIVTRDTVVELSS